MTTPRQLTDEFLVCRGIGHAWDDHPNAVFSSKLTTSQGAMALRCTRCRTERIDYFAKDLSVASRSYRYPDGYTRLDRGQSRPKLRAEMLRRSLLIRSRRNLRAVS